MKRGGNEGFKKRVRVQGPGFQFRVILNRHIPGMVLQFHRFGQMKSRVFAHHPETRLFERLTVFVIQFVPMTVTFMNQFPSISLVGQ